MKKRTLYCIAVLFVAAGLVLGFLSWRSFFPYTGEKAVEDFAPAPKEPAETPSPAKEEESYQSPIDFEGLQALNPDICAWLEIPDTEISFPVVQRPGDDSYYLTHTVDGEESKFGALFTEEGNAADFSDPCTVIYGHYFITGGLFATLQDNYASAEDFAAHATIRLYLPEEEREYQVFTAQAFSNVHLLGEYQHFDSEEDVQLFLEDLQNTRTLIRQTDDSALPREGQPLLVLSTCLQGDATQRYLVAAAMVDAG